MSRQEHGGGSNRVPIDTRKAMVVTSKDGREARKVITQVKLTVGDGTLTNTNSAMGIIVSALGYARCAAAVNGLVWHPPAVVAQDKQQPNGYTDPTTGDMYVCSLFAAYTGMGQLYYTTRTVVFNAKQKILEDYLVKAKNHPELCQITAKGQKPESGSSAWAKYEINDAVDLWFDTTKPEVIKWLIDEKRTVQFAARKAQTMADRNAIKAHPAIIIPDQGNLKETVLVECESWYTPSGPLRIDGSSFTVDLRQKLEAHDAEKDERVIEVEEIPEEDKAAADAEDDDIPFEENEKQAE